MTKMKAFTLVEMLVVIAIIALLALAAVWSFGGAQRSARVDIALDSLVSSFKERQGLARSGRVSLPEGEEEFGDVDRCYGVYLESGESDEDSVAQFVEMPYEAVGPLGADYCDLLQIERNDMELFEQLRVLNIELFGAERNELLVLFKPPFGKSVMGDLSSVRSMDLGEQNPYVVVAIGLRDRSKERFMRFNIASGLAERLYEEPGDMTLPTTAPTPAALPLPAVTMPSVPSTAQPVVTPGSATPTTVSPGPAISTTPTVSPGPATSLPTTVSPGPATTSTLPIVTPLPTPSPQPSPSL